MVRLGIIGYGGFGRFLHQAWNDVPGVRVVALADSDCIDFGQSGARCYRNADDLFDDADVDLVSVATRPSSHASLACRAMDAGKHVLIEKPLALSIEDARLVIETRNRTGLVAAVNHMQRFNPMAEWVAEITRNDWFGPLVRVDVENIAQDETLPAGHWFWDQHESGGILVEHAVHFIDLVHYWHSCPAVSVNGSSSRRNRQQEDRVLAVVRHEDGLIATHYHAFCRPDFFERTTIRLTFSLGDIVLKGWIPLECSFDVLLRRETQTALVELPNASFILEAFEAEGRSIRSSGITYEVIGRCSGKWQLNESKDHIYRRQVQAMLEDVVRAVQAPGHHLRVSLEDGLEAVKIALKAASPAG
jgi:predicted dehydrogenase